MAGDRGRLCGPRPAWRRCEPQGLLQVIGGGDVLRANAMTIGQLSRRTGVPIKVLRDYERLGFVYTLGRSTGNYRLFAEEALWCVQVFQGLRSLGLTLQEIQTL